MVVCPRDCDVEGGGQHTWGVGSGLVFPQKENRNQEVMLKERDGGVWFCGDRD